MSGCLVWVERIALAAGGDLEEAERTALDRHVSGCPACAAELEALQRSMALVREVHEEPIGEAHFAAVRARVMSRIDGRRRWRWAWVAALTAAAAAVAAVVLMRPAPVPAPPTVAVALPAPLVLDRGLDRSLPVAAPIAASKRTRVRAATVREPAPVPTEPVIVKLLTDDPNVVIYWIGDSQ